MMLGIQYKSAVKTLKHCVQITLSRGRRGKPWQPSVWPQMVMLLPRWCNLTCGMNTSEQYDIYLGPQCNWALWQLPCPDTAGASCSIGSNRGRLDSVPRVQVLVMSVPLPWAMAMHSGIYHIPIIPSLHTNQVPTWPTSNVPPSHWHWQQRIT